MQRLIYFCFIVVGNFITKSYFELKGKIIRDILVALKMFFGLFKNSDLNVPKRLVRRQH